MKRFFAFLIFCTMLVLFLLGFSILTFAEGIDASIPADVWEDFEESIPEDAEKYFENGAFDEQTSYFEAIEKMTSAESIVTLLSELFFAEAKLTCNLLLVLLGVLLVSAVLSVVGEQSENKTFRSVMRFCSLGALFTSAGYVFYMHFERLEDFFSRLALLINGMIPVTASIWALGGNVSTATVGSATLYCFLNVFEKLWATSAIPIFVLLLMLGFCDVICTELKSGRILGTVKKIYGFFLGLSMTILLSSLAAQTTLAAVSDSVAARAGRLVSSTVIPIVGGNLGEVLRTVASSVTYLKNIFGIGGIILISILVLPMAISLLLTRFVFGICSTFADIIGCSQESKLLASFSEAYGCMLAVVCGVGMMFVLSLCIFMKTVVAVV